MFVANRALEHIAVADLRPAKRNVRTHSKKQIRQISRSIDKVGFTNPLIIDEQNGVLAGHGRLAAAKEMGLVEVPCIRLSDVSEADRRTYAIADNQIALNAGYDYEILACELTELIDLQIDTSLTGFEQAQIDAILVSATESSPKSSGPEDFFPPLPAPGSVVTQPGDHWVLGRHRLVCGDAKSPEDVSTLMQWDKADMAFLDPPYNVPIAGHVSGLGRTQHREFSEAVGEKSSAEFTDFLETSFANVERACRNGAIVYACMDWRHVGEISAAGNAAFTEHKNICVWAKTNGGMGTFYRSQHELIFVWKVGDQPHTNNFGLGDKGRYRTNVWSYPGVNAFGADRMAELSSHPTVKPVALVADAIRDVSNRGQFVLDTFGGSGTTLIAAEKTGRCARLLEIDPAYCDVIIRRWEKLTGKHAILADDDRTFEDVEIERLNAAVVAEAGEVE